MREAAIADRLALASSGCTAPIDERVSEALDCSYGNYQPRDP